MISTNDLIAWLKAANYRYSSEGIPHKERPFAAMSDFTREHKCSLAFDHPIVNAIFQWFTENSPEGSHKIGSVYTGVYFYDAAFWPVYVPHVFGSASVSALDCLETMPHQIKQMLGSNYQDWEGYIHHWLNCIDYGYGYMDLESGTRLNPRAQQFLGAAHGELNGANVQLLDHRPNVKAILGMRMATEIFLKAVLIQELGLTDEGLKKVSHKLEAAAIKCAEVTKEQMFDEIAKQVPLYPLVSARYEDTEWPLSKVWQATMLAQLTGATVTRLYTDRDMRNAVL